MFYDWMDQDAGYDLRVLLCRHFNLSYSLGEDSSYKHRQIIVDEINALEEFIINKYKEI